MGDAALRSALRDAETLGDAASWMRAAHTLGRAGRLDEAARAALRGARLGGAEPVEPLLDEVAGGRLADLQVSTLGAPRELAKLSEVAWSGDGGTLVAADDRNAIFAFDAASGERRRVAAFPHFARRLWLDPAGGLLLASASESSAPDAYSDVVTLDLETSTSQGPLGLGELGLGIETIRDLVASGDQVVVAGRGQAAAYASGGGANRRTPTWRMTAPLVSLDARGVVSLKRGKLAFHDLLADTARAVVPFAVNRDVDRAFVAACGRRALVVDDHATLVSETGDVLGRRALEIAELARARAVSTSGRRVALLNGHDSVYLLDVLTGESRTIEAPARVRGLAWSPSASRLAFTTDLGTIVTLRADAAAGREEASDESAPAEVPWQELTSGARFWFVRRVGRVVQIRYGQTGQRGSAANVERASEDEARKELERRLRAKTSEGYVPRREPHAKRVTS